MAETWKIIEEEPDYEVSNLGNVRSVHRKKVTVDGFVRTYKPKSITPKVDRDGYMIVCLGGFNKRKVYKVHRLVAKAFIKNPFNLPFINHKDETRTNNVVTNLEWCDAKYNVNYGTAQKRRIEKVSTKVDVYTLKGEFVCSYDSIRECARKLNVYSSGVVNCVVGKTHSCKNHVIRKQGEPFSLNRKECYVTRGVKL